VAADAAGKLVVVGETLQSTTSVSIQSQQLATPRPFESFTFLAWFGANGSFERLRFYDGAGSADVAFAPNGNLYFIAGGSTRPFSFAPEILGHYESFAELTPTGDLVRSHNLSPHLLPGAPDGFYLLQMPRVRSPLGTPGDHRHDVPLAGISAGRVRPERSQPGEPGTGLRSEFQPMIRGYFAGSSLCQGASALSSCGLRKSLPSSHL
jgi:hypothetical protein